MKKWPEPTAAERVGEESFFRALELRGWAQRLLLLMPFAVGVLALASALASWLADLHERRALGALRSYIKRWPKPAPRTWAKCPDGCDEGLDDAGGECETCEGLARVTLQAQAAILAGRMGEAPSGDDAARRSVIRGRYPSLDARGVESVLTAWGRQGKDEAVCL